jgi:hypothetical protein
LVREETPGGLSLRLGRLVWQSLGRGGERISAALVLFDEERVTLFQPLVKIGK